MRKTGNQEYSCHIGSAAAVLGIGLMLFGIYRNELEVVFTKAVNICLECVGIG